MDEYQELLLDAYRGERFGESFFASMAEGKHGVDHAEQLRSLQRIEARTAARLRPLVVAAGLEREGDDDAPVSDGVKLAAGVDETAWSAFLEGLRGALPDFLTKFERLQAIAGDGDDATMRDLVAHEQAIDRFAMLELDRRGDEALAVLHAHLERP
jgi:hypothetical protein